MLTAHLNDRLEACLPNDARFAIAFSGGGDSTALLHALKDHPQRGPVFIVDHGLRSGSAKEADIAKAFAVTCGYDAKVLKWKHDSPQSGLQEKARLARYRLLGEACRHAGIKYLVTAHNENDQAETLLMRYDRQTDWRGAAGMAEMTYGAVWPELAMVNLVRPLLDVSRQRLRNYNRYHHLKWIEDPSNENRDFMRIRARDYLGTHPDIGAHLIETASALRQGMNIEKAFLRCQLTNLVSIDNFGVIMLADICHPQLLMYLLRVASGQGQVIAHSKIVAFQNRMKDRHFVSATLAGAMVERSREGYLIYRDPVAVTGRKDKGLSARATPLNIKNYTQIWDGRWAVSSILPDFSIVSYYDTTNPDDYRAPAKRLTRPILRHYSRLYKDHKVFTSLDIDDVRVESLIRPRLEAMLDVKMH